MAEDSRGTKRKLSQVPAAEEVNVRRPISGLSTFTLQWRQPIVIAHEGLAPKEMRRVAVLHLRNMNPVHVLNSAVAWFRMQCKQREIPRENPTMRHFLLNRCPRLNFPAMTPAEFFSCVHSCHEKGFTRAEIGLIRTQARIKRRSVIGERRTLRATYINAITKGPKAGIYEVPLLRNIQEIQPPFAKKCPDRSTVTLSCTKMIVIHGFGVPAFKDQAGDVTIVLMSNEARLLEKTTSSGVRRLFDSTHDIVYLFFREPILLDPQREYKIHIRAYNGACSAIGDFLPDFTINDIRFVFQHTANEAFTHAIFLLFEDPSMYVDDSAMTLLDLVSFVRRPNTSSSSSSSSDAATKILNLATRLDETKI